MKASQKTKQGAASIFVVIFTTLLLGVITLSFVRIMISEANQTTNYDLSQSAYDSALAGVEDAKLALLKYHECLNQGATAANGSSECKMAIAAITAIDSPENCNIVDDMLKRPDRDGQEVVIQSGTELVAGEATNSMEQAYTCVKISENTDDYLGRLNSNSRMKLVPIRVRSDDLGNLSRIRLEWYNAEDDNGVSASSSQFSVLPNSTNLDTNKEGYGTSYTGSNVFSNVRFAPPTIQMQLIQTDVVFSLSQFDTNGPSYVGNDTNQGTLMLRPSHNGVNDVSSSYAVGLAASNDKSFNNPIDIKCLEDNTSGYWCTANIDLPRPNQTDPNLGGVSDVTRDEATTFLRLVLPYGQPDTSFSVKLYNGSGKQIQFVGVQAKVDATGRANDLFRRVESRIELHDTYFPYPEFTADLDGGGDDSIWKNYWVTRNCWTTGPNDKGTYCVNSGRAS